MDQISADYTANVKTLEANPEYFGVYLNMARHNVFQILNAVTTKYKKLHLREMQSDEQIDHAEIVDVLNPQHPFHREYSWKIYKSLEPYLSCIKHFRNDDVTEDSDNLPVRFNELHQFLKLILKELVELRNSYSHFWSLERPDPSTPRINMIDGRLVYYLDEMFLQAIQNTSMRFRSTSPDIENSHESEDFEHLKGYDLFKNGTYNELTASGLYFFTSLFLERRYVYYFLRKLSGFKNQMIKPFKATLRVFSAFALKLPHEKIISDDPSMSFFLDMVNELNKIPGQLYRHLSQEVKESYNTLTDESIQRIRDNINDESFTDLDELLHKVSPIRRSDDRFAYFAIRFLEEIEAFKDLRFHIRVGKIEYVPYKKKILGVDKDRVIQFNINAFGKLSEIANEDVVFDRFITSEINADITFRQFNPHYHISDNKIAFYLKSADDDNGPFFPEVNYRDGKLTVNSPAPTGFISIYELPKIVLLCLLDRQQQKQGRGAEQIIKKFILSNPGRYNYVRLQQILDKPLYQPEVITRRIDSVKKIKGSVPINELQKREEYKSLLENRKRILRDCTGVDSRCFPDRLKNIVLKISEPSEAKRQHSLVRSLLEDVKVRQKDVQKNRFPRIGEVATFLASDIIEMVIDKAIKQRITSVYYKELQRSLAYFSVEKKLAISLCKELILFDSSTGHPFLNEAIMVNSQNIRELYIRYLDGKAKWLHHTFVKQIGVGRQRKTQYIIPGDVLIPYRIAKTKKEPVDLQEWMKNKLKHPIDLPTFIFDDVLNGLLKDALKKKGTATDERDKFSRLLGVYSGQDTQPFYLEKRIYSLLKKGKKVQEEIDVTSLSFSTFKKKFNADAEINEKKIRFNQAKDRILKLMCEHYIQAKGVVKFDETMSLKEMYPNSNKTPLLRKTDFTKLVYSHSNKPFKICANDTLKNYGKFNQVIWDRRLPVLLDYFETTEVHLPLILQELTEYNKFRELVFEEVFYLERKIAENHATEIVQLHRQHGNQTFPEVQFHIYIEWLKGISVLAEKELDLLKDIRNKFSHNQFIESSHLDFKITTQDQNIFLHNYPNKGWREKYTSISSRIYNVLREIIEKIPV